MHLRTTYNLRLGKKFAHLNEDMLVRAVENELDIFMKYNIVRKGREYPPVPAGSKYIRTYKLRDSFEVDRTRTTPRRYVLDLYNMARDEKGRQYTKYVEGPMQMGFHREHGWVDLVEYMSSQLPDLRRLIRIVLRSYLD